MDFYAPCSPGAEDLLAGELRRIGASSVVAGSRGARFQGDFAAAYAVCLESATASRLLMKLASGPAADENALYSLAVSHPWEEEFPPEASFACRVNGVPRDRDPRYATLRLKDAVADRFNQSLGMRPRVDRKNPDVRIEARWDGEDAVIFLNWSGPPLHERGYRLQRTEAVLRETAAAAVLGAAGWRGIAEDGGAFVDPVCGSGTFLAEAAIMAADLPPGARRTRWGFEACRRHDEDLWRKLSRDASVRYGEGLRNLPSMVGFDSDPAALRTAKANLRRAGLSNLVRLELHDIRKGRPEKWPLVESGLICADPPYGVRTDEAPIPVYNALGDMFRELPSGWRMAVLAPDRKMAAETHLRADTYLSTVSGGMDLTLAVYKRLGAPAESVAGEIPDASQGRGSTRPADRFGERRPCDVKRERASRDDFGDHQKTVESPASDKSLLPDPKAPSLRKALKRNIDALERWAAKTGVGSFRIWDADMPEFNAAVDWYEHRWLHVQEFAAPGKVPAEKVRRRLNTLISILLEMTECGEDNLFLKTRQKGIRPYGKMGSVGEKYIIRENGMRFLVNFTDYLDTGIFLDHRPLRAIIRDRIGKGRFLNLFAYTGTATVMAAAGGASRTVSVDVSNTYLDWGADNLRLNRLDSRAHSFVKSDAFEYLKNTKDSFDMIFIDPPTYSNGTGRRDWSVQEHHAPLIRFAVKSLNPGGTLFFSENFRGFTLDAKLNKEFDIKEITRETIHPDFVKRGKPHRCWEISLP